MNDFYKILQELDKLKIPHCFQSQGLLGYYNLSVTDTHGTEHYFNGNNMEYILECLKVIWGHLLPQGMPMP